METQISPELVDAVLDEVSQDLKISDQEGRSILRGRILRLARLGVRDFYVLQDYASRPRIYGFSMVDPA